MDDFVVWKIGGGVDKAAKAEVRTTIQAAHEFAIRNGLPWIDRPITIFLYHSLDDLAAEFEKATGRSYENWFWPSVKEGRGWIIDSRDFIAMNTSSERYQEDSLETRQMALARSLFNVYRRALTGIWEGTPRDAVSREGPKWLTEGTTEYFAYHALEPSSSAVCHSLRGQDTGLSLDELETREGFSSLGQSFSRNQGFFAVELLADTVGSESVLGYYASLRSGTAWQEMFQAAFGMTAGEFYRRFDEHRAAGFPKDGCWALPPLITLPGAPEYTHWYVGADVPHEYVGEIAKGASLMHEYAASRVMPESGGKVRQYLPGDLDTLVLINSALTGWSLERSREHWNPNFAMAGDRGVADGSWIITNTFSSRYASTDPERRMKVAAHEMFHAYQKKLSTLKTGGGDDEVPQAGPRWLTEGSAEFFAYKAMDAGGVFSYDTERNTRSVEHAKRVDRPLSEMENLRGVRGISYQFFLLGVELLAYHAGEDALIRFYSLQQPGTTWQEAFQIAFGMTVEEFYVLFEEHRAAGFPKVDIGQ